ncbi:MAG: HEAT repeat domain-containing protein [Planctomycetota bacterium]|nr:MAG: HEAT repeat domain-containing protein [Planctomycetota bacterium]
MTQEPHDKDKNNSAQDPDFAAEIQSVKQIIKNLERAEKGVVLYPSQSEILQGFINELVNAITQHLEVYSSVEFSINSTQLIFKKEPVYSNPDRGKSLAFRFYQSGLRTLGFHAGITREEIVDFLEILRRAQAIDSQEDDVVTLLWERDLTHVSYLTIDYFSDEESKEAVRKLAEVQTDPQMVASKIIRHITTTTMEVDKSFVPPEEEGERLEEDLYSLKEDELEELREKISWEKDYNPLSDFTSVLFKIIEDKLPLAEFEDIVKVIGSIVEVMVTKGYFEDATFVAQELKARIQGKQFSSQEQELLWKVYKEISSSKLVHEAGLYFKRAKKDEEREKIISFLSSLHSQTALEPIINLFREVELHPGLLKLIDSMASEDYNLLLLKLHDSHLRVIKGMIRILSKKNHPKVIRELLPFLQHKQPEIRLETVESLSKMDHPMIIEAFIKMIDDPHLSVKKAVLNALSEKGVPEMFQPILEIVEDKTFMERDFYEKKALLVALAKSNPIKALPILGKILETKKWFFHKERHQETRQCAAFALGETHLRDAIPILERFITDKSHEISNACILALKKLG